MSIVRVLTRYIIARYRYTVRREEVLLPISQSFGVWVRGPAELRGDRVVMDFARRERYAPMSRPDLPSALARVRCAGDARAFVRDYGLLRHGERYPASEYVDGTPDDEMPETVSEPVQDLLQAGQTAREALLVLRLLQRACDAGAESRPAIEALAKWAATAWPRHLQRNRRGSAATDRTFLRDVELWLAGQISAGLQGIRFGVSGGTLSGLDLGEFRFVVAEATSLMDFVWFLIAQRLIGKSTVLQCDECREFFIAHDGRQRFCTATCATRARVKRHRSKRQITDTLTKERRRG